MVARKGVTLDDDLNKSEKFKRKIHVAPPAATVKFVGKEQMRSIVRF